MAPAKRVARLARLLAVLGAASAVLLASCRDATAVRVHVYTDVAWEAGRRVVIAAASDELPSSSEPLAEITGPWASPDLGDFVLLPSGDKRAPVRLAVVMGITKDARACSIDRPDGCIFSRRKLGFLEYRTLTVPVNVYSACIGVPCTTDTTCNVLGQCVPADLDPEACASPDGCALPGECSPTAARALDDFALGAFHSCRRFASGRVKCWGHNAYGSLGLGDTDHRGDQPGEMGSSLPFVDLGAGSEARALAAGYWHTCALLDNHQIKCWGHNGYGQLGVGDGAYRGTRPGQMGDALPFVDLGAGRSARAVALGIHHACALLDNDQIKCWGDNASGQLGLGDTENRGDRPGEMGDALPQVDLGAGRSARAVAAGASYTCALLDDGRIKCWGINTYGQLGLGDTTTRGDQPGQMGDALPVVDLGTGRSARAITDTEHHTCALLDNDRVKCWGLATQGQLGLGDRQSRGDQPGEMGDALPFTDLGVGRSARALQARRRHTCALLEGGRFRCWGLNENGQLGLGDTNDRGDEPGEMGDALPFVDDLLGTGHSVRALTAGGGHVCALLDDDRIKCWGHNSVGQLGLGDIINRGDQPGQMGDALPFVDLGP